MIEELFKKLVKQTTPNGFEFLVYDCIPNAIIDDFGNRYVIVGDGPHKHLFTCHLDTYPLLNISEQITIIADGDIIRTDGRTLLGADDKEEWKEFYQTKYPVIKDMYIEEEKWENY